jgi:hypothetical protein
MDMMATLDLVKKALSSPADDTIQKAITVSTGLTAYDLQAPAKNLYPVATPIRNRIPRVGGGTGPATNWKQVSSILGSGFDAMGWVPEGQRSANMSYVTANKSASYVTLGEEDYVTREAMNAGKGFEDVKAKMVLRLLQKTMLKEENALLFGNYSLALGTTPTPTLSATGSGATLPALTYSVICVALTYEGMRQQAATGLVQTKTITGMDGLTYTLNGGVAIKSANATQAITLGQTLTATVAPVQGAAGYAWYVGAVGSEYLQSITTVSMTTFSAPLTAATQLASALTSTDCSNNQSVPAFDGLLTAALNPSNSAYYKALTAGATLSVGTRGNVPELDAMFLSMWNQYQVSPSVIYVNAQEQTGITNKVLTTSSAPLLRYTTDGDQGYGMVGNGVIEYYFNPYALDGGKKIPVKIHPMLPPGTIVGWAEDLPAQYQSSEVPNLAEVKTRADYYQLDWPMRTRREEVGVYMEEVLAVYAPFGMGVINNITAG